MRRLLIFGCAVVLAALSLVVYSRAFNALRVDETRTRLRLAQGQAEVALALDNPTGRAVPVYVFAELLDPQGNVRASAKRDANAGPGAGTVALRLPLQWDTLNSSEKREFIWYRLRYTVTAADARSEGMVSLSEITPDFFEITVTASDKARAGGVFRPRVSAFHPLTHAPAAGVKIAATLVVNEDEDKPLRVAAVTGKDGQATLNFILPNKLAVEEGELEVTARRDDMTQTASEDIEFDQTIRVLSSTDKPLYQPGQTLHFRALLFNSGRKALADKPLLLRVEDPEGNAVFRAEVRTSRFGVASADWPIPNATRLGEYRLRLAADGDDIDVKSFKISRYDLPNFVVTAKPDRAYYLPGQNAEVVIKADYLFGQPVKRGRARLVREAERTWDYKAQKWQTKEAETFEGDTDEQGRFTARLDLAWAHKQVSEYNYEKFQDFTYAAYFTDPTTNRTEQRRFDLRVTQEAIHLYFVPNGKQHAKLPLSFYITATYADGTPAANCAITISETDSKDEDRPADKPVKMLKLAEARANAYGVAKIPALVLPPDESRGRVYVAVQARDAQGLTGEVYDDFYFDDDEDDPALRITTDKTIYRPGETITAEIVATTPQGNIAVDLLRQGRAVFGTTATLHNGRATLTLPYRKDFQSDVTLIAHAPLDPDDSEPVVATRTVIYPYNSDLRLDVQTDRAAYRPGDAARLNFAARAPDGRPVTGALGVLVFDRAVEERARTDSEFGGASLPPFGFALEQGDALGGVTRRSLDQLDTAKPFPDGLDLVAQVLLNNVDEYELETFEGEGYTGQSAVFSDAAKAQLKPLSDALTAYYEKTQEYPRDEATLRRIITPAGVKIDDLRDPWGQNYHAKFSLSRSYDYLELNSAGADKRFGTSDDWIALSQSWDYFEPYTAAIQRALETHHTRTGGYIRDEATLKAELKANGLDFDQIRDRWGQPYRFTFNIHHYYPFYGVTAWSNGPNQRNDGFDEYGDDDDFSLSTSYINYFADTAGKINAALVAYQKTGKPFPNDDLEFRTALRQAGIDLDQIRDPWGNLYRLEFYRNTRKAEKVQNVITYGESGPGHQEKITVIQETITLNVISNGPNGKNRQEDRVYDDVQAVSFTGVLSERPESAPKLAHASQSNGTISGKVTDPNGAVVPNAEVVATNLNTEAERTTKTNDTGRYTLSVPAGTYKIKIAASGFNNFVMDKVPVRLGGITTVDATLQAGTVSAEVTVSALPKMSGGVLDSAPLVAAAGAGGESKAETGTQTKAQLATPRLREYFPETLVWQPELLTDASGRARLDFKFADNITTWKLSVIGSTEDGYIGVAEKELRAFQPFFAEHDPPRVLTVGDEIALPVVLRNYLEQTQEVTVNMQPAPWFALTGNAGQSVSVPAGDAARALFPFRVVSPVNDAKQRVTALGVSASDAIEKPVTVHPDGEERAVTNGQLFRDQATLEVNVPQDVIAGSVQSEVKFYPSLLMHVSESVTGLLERPHGCGEQTISSTYPNLMILRYERQSGQKTAQHTQAERFLRSGYERLLNYRDTSGGFTYWGRGAPDLALTAYALRFLQDAREFVNVDEEVINAARDWLVKQQQASGLWGQPETEKGLTLTAYIVRTLAANPAQGDTISRAMSALRESLKEEYGYLASLNPYYMASFALAVQATKGNSADHIKQLRGLARTEGDTTFWDGGLETLFHGWGRAGRLETTALAVQALAQQDPVENGPLVLRGLLYLLNNKDRYGVWYSTQATINVLDTLIAQLAREAKQPAAPAVVLVNGQRVGTLAGARSLNPLTLDIGRYLKTGRNWVEIRRAAGQSPVSAQIVTGYYVPWANVSVAPGPLRLSVSYDKITANINNVITCTVSTERAQGYGMMLAEIGTPPGAEVDRATLEQAVKDYKISSYDILPDRVAVYLWPRWGENAQFAFKFKPRYGINAQTAPSVLYDYYNPDARAVVAPARFVVR